MRRYDAPPWSTRYRDRRNRVPPIPIAAARRLCQLPAVESHLAGLAAHSTAAARLPVVRNVPRIPGDQESPLIALVASGVNR